MRKGFVFLLAALIVCCVCGAAFAHDVPDLSRAGTLNVAMRYNGYAVPGGAMTIYRVGGLHEDDGNYSFALTGVFAQSGLVLDDVRSDVLAQELAGYARGVNAPGITLAISSDGTVRFESLELGLYLLVQSQAAPGYYPADPFLVGVPMVEDGRYIYDVDASPKVELEKTPPTPTPPPSPPDEEIPKTGQNNWPVPALAMSGVSLFTLGWVLRFRKGKDAYAE